MFLDKLCMKCHYYYNEGALCKCGYCRDEPLEDIGFDLSDVLCEEDLKITLYYFYPNGMWDEDKLTREEALINYPPNKYNWIKLS